MSLKVHAKHAKKAHAATATSAPNPNLLDNEEKADATFAELGLCPELCAACEEAGWRVPTRIQAATIPTALMERDLVGVAQTGSGKTGAYVLPLVHWLLQQPKVPYLSVLVMVPTRELAQQVTEQFVMLGRSVGLLVATLTGGADMVTQACELSKRPHVIVGTPGRIKDHLTNTKGFKLIKLHSLVLDEADKMLDMDYATEIDAILENLPTERQTMLFTATLSTKIDRLQKASLRDPSIVEVCRQNSTVDTLKQYFVFAPFAQMLPFLHYYLTVETGSHILIFVANSVLVQKITLTLRTLGHRALPLMGKMTQQNRTLALSKFKDGVIRILVCTDLAQRGLDIPHTDVVINYALPLTVKDYIHRVGRTARAGSTGKAVNLVSQYDVAQLLNIEKAVGVKFEEIPVAEGVIQDILQRVEDAEEEAVREMREHQQEEQLTAEEASISTQRIAKRKRSNSSALGNDDALHGTKDFGVLRVRRENEEVFGMTKQKQYKTMHQIRREQKRDRKKGV